MKSTIMIIIVILLAAVVVIAAGNVTYGLYMPLIYDASADPTATPKPPTPRPPTPTPTATPTETIAEGGNTCVHVFAARPSIDGYGTKISSQVPSVCSKLEVAWRESKMVVVKAYRLKTDTWGCQQSDFGDQVIWPPVDAPCPPADPIYDPWGFPLWGDYESMDLPYNVTTVCGYCFECGPPYTSNCVESE